MLARTLFRTAIMTIGLGIGIFLGAPAHAQLDFCGCTSSTSLGAFDTIQPASYPPGTQSGFRSIVIPVPDSGLLVFDSLNLVVRSGQNGSIDDGGQLTISFLANTANSPVTLLVKGNFTLGGAATLSVAGQDGSAGSNGVNGVGGLGGPGGFRGGDGAYQIVNFALNGGAGLGPGGGLGGTASPFSNGAFGTYTGIPELLPLLGGAGGGGGSSASASANCSGGGGGGGGGALLIVANSTITINGTINADGGNGGSPSNGGCSSFGHGGSGGAVRLVANTIQGSGTINARGGLLFANFNRAGAGRIRMEAITNTLSGNNTDPVASRAFAPGPIVNPFNPTVRILTVGGNSIPAPPQGVFGKVDIILPAPGITPIVLQTQGVPAGTVLKVTIKPRVNGAPIIQNATLGANGSTCDGSGTCTTTINVDLAAGAYTIEAQATLQTP